MTITKEQFAALSRAVQTIADSLADSLAQSHDRDRALAARDYVYELEKSVVGDANSRKAWIEYNKDIDKKAEGGKC